MTTAVQPGPGLSSTSAVTDRATPNGRRLTLNYLLLIGGECLAKAFTLAAFVYLGRVLGPERYGGLEFIIATMIFFTLPVDFGLGIYGARELARDRRRAADLLRDVAALRLTLAAVSFVFLLVLAAVLPRDGEVKLLLVIYGFSLFAEPGLLQWFFQGHDRMHWVALANLTRKGAFAVFVFVLVRADTPLAWVGLCECASAVAVVAICLAVLKWRLGMAIPWPSQRLGELKKHLRGAGTIGLSEVAWVILWYCPTILLGLLTAGDELGWFGASHRVVMALHTFVWLYFFNLLPSLSRSAAQAAEHLPRLLSRSLALTTWGGMFVALGLTLVGGDLLTLAYGPRFDGIKPSLILLGWLIPLALLSGHYRYLLIACNCQQLEFYGTVISAIAAVVLGAVLIPLYGAVGGAAALLAANLVNFGLAYAFVNRLIVKVPCHSQLMLPTLAVGVAGACSSALAKFGTWPAAAAAGAAYLIMFGAWAGLHFLRSAPVREPVCSSLEAAVVR